MRPNVFKLLLVFSSVLLLTSCTKELVYYPMVNTYTLYVTFPACSNVTSISSEWFNVPKPEEEVGAINAYVLFGDTQSQLPATITSTNPPHTIDFEYVNGTPDVDGKIRFNMFFTNGSLITLNNPYTCEIKVCVTRENYLGPLSD